MAAFKYQEMFEHGEDTTEYRRLEAASAQLSTVELDGFRVEFPPGRARGSRYVTQTLLSVDGRLIA